MTPKHMERQVQFENQILDLIDNADQFTRSDLQGVVSALVSKIMNSK